MRSLYGFHLSGLNAPPLEYSMSPFPEILTALVEIPVTFSKVTYSLQVVFLLLVFIFI